MARPQSTTLGYIGTFSGYEPGVTATLQLVHGIEAYLGLANEERERPITLALGDDLGDPKTAAREAQRLIDEAHIPLVVFAAASPVAQAVVEYTATRRVAVAGTGGALLSPLFRPVNPWLFTARTPYESHGAAMVEFLAEQAFTRIALMSTADGTGHSYERGMRSRLGRLASDWDLVHVELVPRAATDFGAAGARLAAAHPDVVISTSFASTTASVRDAAAARGLDVPWALGPSATNPETVELIGADLVEGWFGCSSFEVLTSGSPDIKSFLEVVHATPTDAPTISSLTQLGWTSARAAVAAIDAVGDDINGESVRTALEGLAGDWPMMVPFALSPDNHLLNCGVQIVRVQGGSFTACGPIRSVDPDTIAD